MRGISHIFDVTCRWLRSLLKNDEENSVPEERWSFWILCYGEVQEYPSVQRRTGMTDMRNVNFCNWSLVFNHCHSWGIQLPSFLSFKSLSRGNSLIIRFFLCCCHKTPHTR